MIRVPVAAKCPECLRVFDLLDESDADEWFSGHDCEPPCESCGQGWERCECPVWCSACCAYVGQGCDG